MKKIGIFKAKDSRRIKQSRIGIGMECLDRQMWDDTDEAYQLLGMTGVKHSRIQTGWNRCEEEAGVLDFGWLDRIVDKLLEQGVQPWFCISYGNIHHSEATEPDAVGWVPIYNDEERKAWCRYVAELVKHFRSRVTHYEVWNEADISSFWMRNADASEYMDLLKMTVPVIREHQPDAKIIGGAMGTGFAWQGFATLEEYLKQGFAELVDIYTYHRYRVVPELYSRADFECLRETFKAYGGEHIELWQAESGCPSRSSTTHALANTPLNEEVQAKVLCRSIMTDLDMGVDYTCYFHFSDFKFYYRNGFCEVPNYFGLITFDTPPKAKPSYYAFQRICNLFDADTVRAPRTKLDMSTKDMYESKELYSFQVDIVNSRMTAFTRNGYPLISCYMPADLLSSYAGNEPWQPRDIELHIWTPEGNIEQAVLIDPISGDCFELETSITPPKVKNVPTSQLTIHDVPLKDYPVIVTDRRAVADMIEFEL